MKTALYEHHPKSQFIFVVGGAVSERVRTKFDALLSELASTREWIIGPPQAIDFIDDDEKSSTVGGQLEIYSALPPFGKDLPKEIDRKHFEEVNTIINALVDFSRNLGLEIGFELDDTYVGRIKDGEADRLLRIGLLGEWEKVLGNPE